MARLLWESKRTWPVGFGSWNLPVYLMGAPFLLGVVCWTLEDPARPVFDE